MRSQSPSLIGAGRRARVLPVLALAAAVGLAGCDSLIEVENPNNVKIEDLDNPTVASSLVSGVLNEVSDAYGHSMTSYATITDELTWIGSRDAWNSLEQGFVSITTNEFTDAAFPDVAEARWLADEAIKRLSAFDQAGELPDRLDLARAYMYAGIIYMIIPAMWEDFVVASDREEPGPAVGPNNMDTLFDTAIQHLTSGLAIAQAEGSSSLETDILALRASAAHQRVIWRAVNPSPSATFVTDAGAAADAQAVINRIGGQDFVLKFRYSDATTANTIGAWVNQRLEHRVDVLYGVPDPSNKTITGVALLDPLDGGPDPGLAAVIADFCNISGTQCTNTDLGPLWVTSEREMYLILAEDALVAPDLAAAEGFINDLRDLDNLSTYDRTAPGAPTVGAMIQHHRMGNLFLQGRRLSDMYRFGIQDPRWTAASETVNNPGIFMPITTIECRANPNLNCT